MFNYVKPLNRTLSRDQTLKQRIIGHLLFSLLGNYGGQYPDILNSVLNYYNIWFLFIAESPQQIWRLYCKHYQIKSLPGVSLPAFYPLPGNYTIQNL